MTSLAIVQDQDAALEQRIQALSDRLCSETLSSEEYAKLWREMVEMIEQSIRPALHHVQGVSE